ncbi:hypothetical protein SH661x_002515 [Planctomicrobium sp. SH661]|uniref:hypothetical protein n=1 Tax=Planctomicrobium sp. SH661 TaxID=3448124 RepID=UPI003F5BD003
MPQQIHPVRQLLKVAAGGESSEGRRPNVKIELVKFHSEYQITHSEPLPLTGDAGTLQMHDGDIFALRITNHESPGSGRPVYVTVLHIDSNPGIEVILP